MVRDPELTIFMTRHSEPDSLILGCLRAVARQVGVRGRVLLLDQQPDAGLDDEIRRLSTPTLRFERQVIPDAGISYARNRAVEACETELLLCLDPDVLVEPDWAAPLAEGLLAGGASLVAGRILARWAGRRPFLARSRSVLEMYSILDHGEETRACTKLVGGSFGMHLGRLGAEARFDPRLGRSPESRMNGEDQELADRVLETGGRVLYCGKSLAHHLIDPDRCRLSWLCKRVWSAGFDRGARGGRPRPTHPMRLEDRILTLPLALPYALGLLSGRRAGRKRTALNARS